MKGGRSGGTHHHGGRHRRAPHTHKHQKKSEILDQVNRSVVEDLETHLATVTPRRAKRNRHIGNENSRYREGVDAFFRGAVYRSSRQLKTKRSALPGELFSLLIPQSIVGHAQQGHVGFAGVRYPNATIEDVLEAIGMSFKDFWSKRQGYIDDIRVWLDRAVRDPADPRLRRPVNEHGHYLAGCSLVPELSGAQEVIDVLAGFVYASRMDTYDPWRQQVYNRFGIQMGGGRTVPIDLDRLKEQGLTLTDLASDEHTFIDYWKLVEQGVIIDEATIASRSVTNGYVRRARGFGVSDDNAANTAGVLRGKGAYLGVILGDATDTLDKSAMEIRPGGQDEELGKFVVRECERNGIDIGLDDDACVTWIALAAIDPQQPTQWLHCSQRYFYELAADASSRSHARAKYYPAQLHLRFVEEFRSARSFDEARDRVNGIPSILTSFTRRSNRELYRVLINRLERFQNDGHISLNCKK